MNKVHRRLRLCIQLIRPENANHFRHMTIGPETELEHRDQIVCVERLKMKLLAKVTRTQWHSRVRSRQMWQLKSHCFSSCRVLRAELRRPGCCSPDRQLSYTDERGRPVLYSMAWLVQRWLRV